MKTLVKPKDEPWTIVHALAVGVQSQVTRCFNVPTVRRQLEAQDPVHAYVCQGGQQFKGRKSAGKHLRGRQLTTYVHVYCPLGREPPLVVAKERGPLRCVAELSTQPRLHPTPMYFQP